jgi:hypothetical protein
MSFWSKVGDVFKSVGKGVVSLIPGMGMSVASNAIGGAMSNKDAKRQHQYDLEKMATQHGYTNDRRTQTKSKCWILYINNR